MRTTSDKRTFAAIVAAQFFSLLGQEVLQFVLPLYLLGLTGSGSLYGVVIACGFVPYTLLSPVGGVIADRTRRRGVMLAVNAALVLTMGLFLVGMGRVDALALVVFAVVVSFSAQALYQPAIQSTVPFVLAEKDVERGVALVSQIGMLTTLGGPVLGAFVYGVVGIAPVVAVSAVAFAVSGGLVWLLVRLDCTSERSERGVVATVACDLAEAGRFLAGERVLAGAIAMGAFVNLFGASLLNVGTAYLVTITLGLTSVHASAAQAAIGVGGIVGAALVALRPAWFGLARTARCMVVAAVCLAGLGAALAVGFGPGATYAALLASYALAMAGFSVVSVALLSYLQLMTPPALVGKAVALFMVGANCATPLGQIGYGVVLDWVPAAAVVLATCSALLVGSVVWGRFLRATQVR